LDGGLHFGAQRQIVQRSDGFGDVRLLVNEASDRPLECTADCLQ
jgi:hypothetical protein